jgi:hypothetical protein
MDLEIYVVVALNTPHNDFETQKIGYPKVSTIYQPNPFAASTL